MQVKLRKSRNISCWSLVFLKYFFYLISMQRERRLHQTDLKRKTFISVSGCLHCNLYQYLLKQNSDQVSKSQQKLQSISQLSLGMCTSCRQVIRSWSICFELDFVVKFRSECNLKAVGLSLLIWLSLLKIYFYILFSKVHTVVRVLTTMLNYV